MTTSGNWNYNRTRDQIIQLAARHIQIKEAGQNLEKEYEEVFADLLNVIVKDWQKDGLHLWKDEEAALFLNVGQRTYEVGADTRATKGDWVSTSTALDITTTTDLIPVTSTTFTAYSGKDYIPQKDDWLGISINNVLNWYQVLGNPSATEIRINGQITDTVDAGETVYIYREAMDKPLKIYQENVRLWQNNNYELPLHLLDWTEYNLLPQKDTRGQVVQMFYNPQINTSQIAVWPTTYTVDDVLLFRYQSPIELFDSASDTQDFPAEWVRALSWALAAEAGHSFGIPPARQASVDARAASLKEQVLDWDQTNASIFLQPQSYPVGGWYK